MLYLELTREGGEPSRRISMEWQLRSILNIPLGFISNCKANSEKISQPLEQLTTLIDGTDRGIEELVCDYVAIG